MPELTSIQSGTLFSARTFKRLGQTVWANTYELIFNGATPPTDVYQYLQQIAGVIALAEANIHSANIILDRVVISSVEPDSVPYNPETFAVFTYNIQCDGFVPALPILPLTFCVLVKKAVQFGRSGNLLYRGATPTTGGTLNSQGFTLNTDNINRIQNALNTMLNQLQLLDAALAMVKLSDTGAVDNVRVVTGVTVRPVATSKKLYNRYFDIGNNQGGNTA